MGTVVRGGRVRSTPGGWMVLTTVGLCLLAVLAGWQPVAAADASDEEAPIGNLWAASDVYEYSTALIVWDPEDGTYRSGEEEGSFAWLLNLPGTEGWEFVTIMAESWFETPLDDRQAWDVFRWRVVYRRPFEPSEPATE